MPFTGRHPTSAVRRGEHGEAVVTEGSTGISSTSWTERGCARGTWAGSFAGAQLSAAQSNRMPYPGLAGLHGCGASVGWCSGGRGGQVVLCSGGQLLDGLVCVTDCG